MQGLPSMSHDHGLCLQLFGYQGPPPNVDCDPCPLIHLEGLTCATCWQVLFDFPRDPSEYVRRAGRVSRGAGGSGVVSILVLGRQASRTLACRSTIADASVPSKSGPVLTVHPVALDLH